MSVTSKTLGAAVVFAALLSTNSAPARAEGAGMSDIGSNMSASASEGGAHDHAARPVDPALPVPGLTHLVFPDAIDGYNVQILARNFTFTPAAINRDVVANQGHAHIDINGVKISRVYGRWHHLPSSLFSPGVNTVSVTLNANDHSTWALANGEPIASTVPVLRPDGG